MAFHLSRFPFDLTQVNVSYVTLGGSDEFVLVCVIYYVHPILSKSDPPFHSLQRILFVQSYVLSLAHMLVVKKEGMKMRKFFERMLDKLSKWMGTKKSS